MALKITDITKDIPILNRALEQLDHLNALARATQQNVTQLSNQVGNITHLQDAIATNNVVFTWNGASLTFTWPAAYVKSTTGINLPIAAGTSTPLTASTYYWAAWNPIHKTMSFATNVSTYQSIPAILILSQVFAGTAAQTHVAGGGGSDPGGAGIGGRTYPTY